MKLYAELSSCKTWTQTFSVDVHFSSPHRENVEMRTSSHIHECKQPQFRRTFASSNRVLRNCPASKTSQLDRSVCNSLWKLSLDFAVARCYSLSEVQESVANGTWVQRLGKRFAKKSTRKNMFLEQKNLTRCLNKTILERFITRRLERTLCSSMGPYRPSCDIPRWLVFDLAKFAP